MRRGDLRRTFRLSPAFVVACATGCRAPDAPKVRLAQDVVAALGSAAKVGLTPEDMKALDDAVVRGDRKAAQAIGSKCLRTPAEKDRIDKIVLAEQARVDEVSR